MRRKKLRERLLIRQPWSEREKVAAEQQANAPPPVDPLAEAARRGKNICQVLYPGADVAADELEFANAVDWYKRHYHRPYPTSSEILAVAKALGYRKVLPTGSPLGSTADLTALEDPSIPSGRSPTPSTADLSS